MRFNNDQLEEQGKLEICSHCKSLNIQVMELSNGAILLCKNCGTSNLTEIVTEEEYKKLNGQI